MRALKRLDAWLNGQSLRGLDAIVLVPQITEEPPQIEATYGENAGGHGQRLLQRRRTSRRITVTVQLRELYDLARRAAVLDALNAWAGDGLLLVSYRPGKQIPVRCVSRPAMGAARDVLSEYAFGFDAAAQPFWEDVIPEALTLTGSDASGTLIVPGTEPCRITATITPTGGDLTAFSISAGDCAFEFADLDIAQDTPVTIDYVDHDYLAVTAGGVSLLDKRTAASDDDLIVSPGRRTVAFEANTACAVTVYARGLWT